jgi:hypothetical protein
MRFKVSFNVCASLAKDNGFFEHERERRQIIAVSEADCSSAE